MYQQQAPQPRDENSWSGARPEYEEGYAGNLQQSDQLADAIARRLQSQAPSSVQIPVSLRPPSMVPAGVRLALAIISVLAMIPISIVLGQTGAGGLISLGIAGAVILFINVAFNAAHRY